MPKIVWMTIADYALMHDCSRQHVYRSIRRGDVANTDWQIDANGQYTIKASAPVPPKRSAGRKAEMRVGAMK